MAKVSKKNLDFTLLLSAFLVIALSLFIFITVNFPKTETKASENPQYWITYGPLGTPTSAVDTAKELLTTLSTPDNKAMAVSRWLNGGWDGYYLQFGDHNNFSISVGQGYVVLFEKMPTLNYYSKLPFTPVYSLTYSLVAGGNFISLPRGLNTNVKTVENICTSVKNQSGTPVSVGFNIGQSPIRYDYSNYWTIHTCGTKENNVPVVPGTGYWVQTKTASTWKI